LVKRYNQIRKLETLVVAWVWALGAFRFENQEDERRCAADVDKTSSVFGLGEINALTAATKAKIYFNELYTIKTPKWKLNFFLKPEDVPAPYFVNAFCANLYIYESGNK
jgi:hypothetical protein